MSDVTTDTREAVLDAQAAAQISELRPGHDVQLQVAGSKARIVARYVGQRPGHYLLFRGGRRQEDAIEALRFATGEAAVARLVLDGTVVGFRARVLIQHRTPEPTLYLHWPEEIVQHSARAAPRISCLASCRLTIAGERYEGALLDVSETGCRVDMVDGAADLSIENGSVLELTLLLPGQPENRPVNATVRRCRARGDRLLIGLQFDQVQSALMDGVRRYLDDAGAPSE